MSNTHTIEVGELLYEVTARFTKITEYGLSLDDVVSGAAAPPASGARFDIAFEGRGIGPRMNGTVTGVDYLYMRADGRMQLHIHGDITTDDGAKIAFFADGTSTPEPNSNISQLRENVMLTTASPDYAWVNTLPIWARGTVDLDQKELNIKGYVA